MLISKNKLCSALHGVHQDAKKLTKINLLSLVIVSSYRLASLSVKYSPLADSIFLISKMHIIFFPFVKNMLTKDHFII